MIQHVVYGLINLYINWNEKNEFLFVDTHTRIVIIYLIVNFKIKADCDAIRYFSVFIPLWTFKVTSLVNCLFKISYAKGKEISPYWNFKIRNFENETSVLFKEDDNVLYEFDLFKT